MEQEYYYYIIYYDNNNELKVTNICDKDLNTFDRGTIMKDFDNKPIKFSLLHDAEAAVKAIKFNTKILNLKMKKFREED